MPSSHAPRAQSDWSRAKLRIWCVGGWWCQIAGRPRQRLDGDDAASALLRHLAVRLGERSRRSELQLWLSRSPNRPIGADSLNTAVSKLRGMLKELAGGGEVAERIARELLPRPEAVASVDGASSEAAYRLGEAVWVDIHHAPSPHLGTHLLGPSFRVDASPGRGVKGELQGREQLHREVEETLEAATSSLSDADLDPHLKDLTPPISSLTALVPMVLDRLGQGRMLSILAGPDSGRMHLAEAVELGARIYCGRSTEQIREQPEGGTVADDSDLRAQQPGHLCVIDLTRPIKEEQIERLKSIRNADRAGASGPPALLLVREGPLPESLSFLGERWAEEEPVQLPPPEREDVLEAYLLGTEGSGPVERRRAEFVWLWDDYERAHRVSMGLRAASSAATIGAERGTPPQASELPGAPSQDVEFGELNKKTRYLARCLAWFGNRPFELEDARRASGYGDLRESEVFDIATQIPGRRKVFELRPQLLAAGRPPAEAHRRMCEYLIDLDDVESVVERWPGRALRILERDSVPVEARLDLANVLFETCRDQGLAKKLAQAMARLRRKAGPRLGQRLARFEIERARLLTYLGDFEEAGAILAQVTGATGRGGEWSALKARARLRRAIAASWLGEAEQAEQEARAASRHQSLRVKIENFHGWEATHTARFEEAIARFEKALSLGGDDEERADAVVGMSRDLIRLGRPREAEEALAKLKGLKLRRHTRDRVARVSASLCHLRGDPAAGIDKHIDPALLSASSNYSSASALLLEASAFLHLEAGEANAAAEDIERSLAVLKNSGGRPSSATRYVRALIYEAEADAARGRGAAELLARAREEARRALGPDIERNPWARARAHTLRGRLALRAEDWDRLAESLAAALAAHRELDLLCPGVLVQTLELTEAAADAWQMRREGERVRELVRALKPADSPAPLKLEEALAPVAAVLERVEAGPPPLPLGAGRGSLRAMGRVGEAIARGSGEMSVRQGALGLRVLVPRTVDGMEQGFFEIAADAETLVRHPASPARPLDLVAQRSERRLVQRYALAMLLVTSSDDDEQRAFLSLGEWMVAFRAIARESGVALVEPIAVEAAGLEALTPSPQRATVALALAEMPVLA